MILTRSGLLDPRQDTAAPPLMPSSTRLPSASVNATPDAETATGCGGEEWKTAPVFEDRGVGWAAGGGGVEGCAA